MPEFEETTQFLYQTVQWIFSGIGVTILLEIYGCFKKKRKARKVDWKDKTKYVDDKFYICLLFSHMFVSAIIILIIDSIRNLGVPFVVSLFVELFLCCIVIYFTYKFKRVRLTILRVEKIYKHLLISLPIILITIGIEVGVYKQENAFCLVLYWVCLITMIICEFIGLIKFNYSYTRYEHSYANFILKNGTKIEYIKTDSFYKKGDWIEYETINKKGKCIYEEIVDIEYFGKPRYDVRDVLGRKYDVGNIDKELL